MSEPVTPYLPLHRHSILSTSRIDEAVAEASRSQHPVQAEFSRPRSPFSFQLNHVSLGSMTLCHVRLEHEAPWTARSRSTGEEYHLQINLEGGGRVACGRREWVVGGRRRGLLISPGRSSIWRAEGGFREISVNLDRRAVDRHFEALTGRPAPSPVDFEASIDTSRCGGAAVAAIVREVVAAVDHSPGIREVAAVQYEEWLLDALLQGLPHNHSHLIDREAPSGSIGTVVRAEEYIAARLTEPLTIRRVALAIGVSVRTLQRSFARHRDDSPKQFLARRRLRLAREILLDGEVNVTQAALASGHSHLGQFSVDYRRRYGEPPSATLRRHRGSVAFPIAFFTVGD